MNVVLQTHFTTVTASLGQQKSRVLIADRAKPTVQLSYPRQVRHPDVDLTVCAHGGCFAGTSIDLGTRFLASFLNQLDVSASRVVDLGCGTGVLAAMAARTLPRADVLAVDESRAAVLSARATVGANGLAGRVQVTQAHLLSELPDASVDVVLCNPPFHRGAARDSDAALRMFAEAGRTLRPGGELWTVFNAHLPYLPALRRLVGSTKVAGQNRSFFVTRSRARTSS
jgi:16S rRNA (guanine1207-N2)-methyltransferase